MLRTQSDERLVDLVRAGSEPAFEAIVTRYRRALLRYCSRILPEERAEDAVQQTFVRAYDAMRDGDAELRLRPWLYRIAHNTALNALRDKALRHEQLDDRFDGVERPDQALERNMSLREVLGAVQDLPERQREAILLRELEGRSYDQIAAELGVTGGAVRQLLNRARHSVRAAATAVTPAGLITRIPWGAPGESVAARVAELCSGAAAGAAVTKVCATALVTGAVVGGVAVAPEGPKEEAAKAKSPAAEREGPGRGAGAADSGGGSSGSGGGGAVSGGDLSGGDGGSGRGGGDRSGRGDGDGDFDSSGPGPGGQRERHDSSGPGSGEEDFDSSGPGSGGDSVSLDSSGPGSGDGGSDNSGSGSSGSGSSGSGSSGSGSSGSDSSGSGSSGSGSSGSGSSGSGSGDGSDFETDNSGPG
ncbi:MAG TPA: sigma-70 family RNA polymerase sigma factor [Thermoleophilaceae bacterium]|nr:sigma-70 family RNA polymerase sigma factor [Thermoleophilaceae bacterium]